MQNATSISSLQSQSEMSSQLPSDMGGVGGGTGSGGLGAGHEGMYGLLWVHLLAGRGLRASTQSVGEFHRVLSF